MRHCGAANAKRSSLLPSVKKNLEKSIALISRRAGPTRQKLLNTSDDTLLVTLLRRGQLCYQARMLSNTTIVNHEEPIPTVVMNACGDPKTVQKIT